MNIVDFDTQLFYWVNQHHTPFLDWVMWTASQSWSWAIVLVAAVAFMIAKGERRSWGWLVAGIALCFLLSDRISVLCFKDVFCRLRPCHALADVRMFRTSCGGAYGFVSSHAANVFALALFLSLRHKKHTSSTLSKLPAILFPSLLILWACLVGYSRPYLGKHYPGDVICGGLLGIAVGIAVYFIIQSIENWANSTLLKKKSSL